MRERREEGERGGGDGIGVYPSQRDARRYFRGRGLSLFGASSTEFMSEALFGLRSSAGLGAVFRICSAVPRHMTRPNKHPKVG